MRNLLFYMIKKLYKKQKLQNNFINKLCVN